MGIDRNNEPPNDELPNDELPNDEQGIRGQRWLARLLEIAGVKADVKVERRSLAHYHETGVADLPTSDMRDEAGDCWLVIDDRHLSAEQVAALIGEQGATLDAMQYLTSAILNLGQAASEQKAYTVELAGYRTKRQAELLSIVDQVVHQVRQTGQEKEIKHLSSAERRQVHTFLQTSIDLETFSRGREPDRTLVVRLKTQD